MWVKSEAVLSLKALVLSRLNIRFLLLGCLLLSACGDRGEQQRICERLIPWQEASLEPVEILHDPAAPTFENAVLLRYRVSTVGGGESEHWLGCNFAASGRLSGRTRLMSVISDRGEWSDIELAAVQVLWLEYYEPRARRRRQGQACRDF